MTKASAPEELVQAAKKVMAGGQYVSASVGEALAMTVRTGVDKMPHERLFDREYEVLCLIASGKTLSDIAEEVHLSVTTHQHLSGENPRQDESQDQCRTDPLCHAAWVSCVDAERLSRLSSLKR
ncbi:MAG: hypothetical protein U0361_06210 [Nitrospiraceae bacterium]